MLTEMYSSPQYLSDDLKKIGHAYSDAHELQKVVNFKAIFGNYQRYLRNYRRYKISQKL